MMKRIFLILIVFCSIAAYGQNDRGDFLRKNYRGKSPKYIFYFIGDGMGFSQIHLAEGYLKAKKGHIGFEKLNMNKTNVAGYITTHSANRFITGSAAAGTALATGFKTSINSISVDSAKIHPIKTVAEYAHDKGMNIGIITSVSIDHATPAVFYAHESHRNKYYEISVDLSKSGFPYFAGGSFKQPEGKKGKTVGTKDNTGIAKGNVEGDGKKNSELIAQERGYRFIKDREDFTSLKYGDRKVIINPPKQQGGNSLTYAIDRKSDEITLQELTAKGIELLDDDKKGFFMMIEGGKIDWASHGNDAGTTLHEVIDLDNAVSEAMDFYYKHPDETLIVITADHETGGMTLGTASQKYESNLLLLDNQKMSYNNFYDIIDKYRKENKNPDFDEVMSLIKENFGIAKDAEKALRLSATEVAQFQEAFGYSMLGKKPENKKAYALMYGDYDPISVLAVKKLAAKAGIGWTTFSHTASPVPVRATGVGAIIFSGDLDNTDMGKNLIFLVERAGKE